MNLGFQFFFNSILLGIGLAMDAFSVSLANGLNEPTMPKGKMVIFGHAPTFIYQPNVPMAVWVGKQKIAMDCGSGLEYGGRLACLRLDDMKVFYSKEKE